jgi:hypoxanthine-guanine phosphoribosyltransferase
MQVCRRLHHPPLPLSFSKRRQIAADYADKRPVVIGTLKGAVVFMADLVRAMEPPPPGLELEFVRASSYGAATVSSGKVDLRMVGPTDIKGRHVLLVSDGRQ